MSPMAEEARVSEPHQSPHTPVRSGRVWLDAGQVQPGVVGYWEAEQGGVLEQMPPRPSLKLALSWADQRAARIYVQGNGWKGYRSYGAENEFDFPNGDGGDEQPRSPTT